MSEQMERGEEVPARILSIAGSDSGGGAGIQADLKTIAALGGYGMAVITSVTAQNTLAVTAIHDIPADVVGAQIDAVLSDIGADAIKTGMLSSSEIIEAVAKSLDKHPVEKLVVDPVMVAKSGDTLLKEEARETLVNRLLPKAWLVTPNVPEAEALSGIVVDSDESMREAALKIHAMGPKFVLMKGGHLDGDEAIDYLFDGETMYVFSAPRLETENTHGTGCTYSSAIATLAGQDEPIMDAVAMAKQFLTGAIACADWLEIGHGHGPLDHMWCVHNQVHVEAEEEGEEDEEG